MVGCLFAFDLECADKKNDLYGLKKNVIIPITVCCNFNQQKETPV